MANVGTCRFCGKETKNNTMHERLCPKNPNRVTPFHNKSNTEKKSPSGRSILNNTQPKPDVAQQIVNGDLQTDKKPSLVNKIKSAFHKKPNLENSKKFPSKLLSTREIKGTMSEQTQNLTDEQKFLRFFGNLPKWTEKKPGKFEKWLAKTRTKGDFQIKLCVFVDEDEGQHKQAYIPYNTELGFLVTDTGFYDVPMKDAEPIFLDKKRFAPLVNRKNYKDEFDLPEDFAESLLNTGIFFSQLKQFKDLIGKIDQFQMIMYGAIFMVILIGAFSAYNSYADGKHYQLLADRITNLSEMVGRGR